MSSITRRLPGLLPLVVASSLSLVASAQVPTKQVAAPASDILSGVVRLPAPEALALRSDHALLPVRFEGAAGGASRFEVTLPVEASERLSLAILEPRGERWRVAVQPPGLPLVPLEELMASGLVREAVEAIETVDGPLTARCFELDVVPPGAWRVRVERDGGPAGPAHGWLFARGATPLQLASHLTTHERFGDREIGVAAHLHLDTAPDTPLGSHVRRAWIELESAAGRLHLPMHDDGEHEDAEAEDGIYGARLPAGLHGKTRARVVVEGVTPSGAAFLRTQLHAFDVTERRAVLSGALATNVLDDRTLALDLGAWTLDRVAKLHLSAEVWATRPGEGLVPVCWLSRMVRPERADEVGATDLRLELDARWLNVAGAGAPLELRHVRLQDPGTHLPYDRLERLPVPGDSLPMVVGQPAIPLTQSMLTGSPGTSVGPFAAAPATAIRPALMLSHGWCSGGSIWPAADFSQPKVEFMDPDANRTLDEFAVLLRSFAQSQGLTSFGILGHSQGGMAALHLRTYYASGLDRAEGGRRIQSVGTPYQGTPLASLGFATCGNNTGLTPNGAALWLSGIPSWARAEVHYWTTTNSGSACNFFTNLLLPGADDGVVQQSAGQLPGGVNMGNVPGWCHSTGLSEPAQYTDAVLNADRDANASR